MAAFPYEYVGGGYFRARGVPKGQAADMLHGMEVVDAAFKHAREVGEHAAGFDRAVQQAALKVVASTFDVRDNNRAQTIGNLRQEVERLEAAIESALDDVEVIRAWLAKDKRRAAVVNLEALENSLRSVLD